MMNNISASRPPLADYRPPLSPMSIAGSDWSGISTYKSPTDSGSTMSRTASSSGPSMGRSSNTSPPSSVARSSDGMRLYEDSPNARPRMRHPPRRDQKLDDEVQVSRQHAALKALLEPYLRVDKNNVKANKARDKLLRLTQIQFQELSTDVYDELQRRQGAGDRLSSASNVTKVGPTTDVPEGTTPFLMPKPEFHPKRNQARQKLSTLPTVRFRDLATDVFYELERRYPAFTGGSIDRVSSPPSSIKNGGPNEQDRRPKPAPLNPNAPPRPGGPGGPGGYGPGPGMVPPKTPTGLGPNGSNSLGRPLPKNLPTNPPTNDPEKPALRDDYDDVGDEEDDDAFGLEDRFRQSTGTNRRAPNGRESLASNTSSTRAVHSNETDKKLITDYQSQISTLQRKIEQLEISSKDKDREIDRLKDEEQNWREDEEELRSVRAQMQALQGRNDRNDHALESKAQELTELKNSLESKLANAQNLNSSLQNELARLRSENQDLEDWRDSHECGGGVQTGGGGDADLQRKYSELLQVHENLKVELRQQRETTEEVRKQAMVYLQEMRSLTVSGDVTQSHDELTAEIAGLREEVKDWKARYTKTKTQLRNLRAASIGLQYATESNISKVTAHSDPNGLVKDIYITKCQLVVDEILRTARIDPKGTLVHMKAVAVVVRAITKGIEASHPPDEVLKMSMRVEATGQNLMTAIRNHASADGLSPVSLVDAATSHFTASVVDLAKKVKVRPTPSEELEDDDVVDGDTEDGETSDLLSVPLKSSKSTPIMNGTSPARTSIDSVYSTSSFSSRYSNQRGSTRNQSGTWSSKRDGKFSAMNPLGINALPTFEVQEEQSEVEELKNFLISQTNGVIESIQRLLQELRTDNSQLRQLRGLMDDVILFVGKVIQSTENAMDQARSNKLKDRIGHIVKSLDDSMQKMLGMKVEDIENEGAASKDFNSRLAGHCFAMARETKELVRVVEEIDNEAR
ncbi:component of the polarisome [Orbilia brochopaga]|uniref:Component of the polarisome n=1 Tax=Orbilia brochopaga TaxID=3140254 RepID=A0AAV9UAV7_9PEZI